MYEVSSYPKRYYIKYYIINYIILMKQIKITESIPLL